MKIGTRLTLRYTGFMTATFLLLVAAIYLFPKRNRSDEFFRDLKKEGITKANLFFDNRVDARTMQSIYLNNHEFTNEVEVAVCDATSYLFYHDAKQIDLVGEAPEMIDRILQNKSIEFYQDGYQVIGLLYTFHGKPYVITATAFGDYGCTK